MEDSDSFSLSISFPLLLPLNSWPLIESWLTQKHTGLLTPEAVTVTLIQNMGLCICDEVEDLKRKSLLWNI